MLTLCGAYIIHDAYIRGNAYIIYDAYITCDTYIIRDAYINYESVSKSFRTESLTKYRLTFGINC